MMTNEWAKYFSEVEAEVSREKGKFVLFALFLREESPDRWDLVASAPWLWKHRQAGLDYLVQAIRRKQDRDLLPVLSRVIVADPQDPGVRAINQAFKVDHSMVEVRDSNLLGQPVKRAIIFASERLKPAAA